LLGHDWQPDRSANRALYLAHRTGIWAVSRRRSATKQGEHRRRNQETGGYPSWIRPISLGNRKIDSMCEKMNPELESGLREQMTEAGGF